MPPVRLAQHTEEIQETSPAEALSGESPLAQPLRLARPQSAKSSNSTSKPIDATSSMITVGTSLAVVLGLFFVLTYFFRRNLPKSVQAPPGEVLEVLGRAPLPGKQQLQVVRFGSKLVLLSVTADGVEAVSEITAPDEVQELTALCRRESPGSSAHAFQEILTQMGREPARGFVDQRAAKVNTV
jgi:flagellar biogenesis protein FliO